MDPPNRWRNRRGGGIPPDDVGRLPGRCGVAADGQRRGWPARRLRPYEHPEPDRRPACRPYGSRVVGLPHRRDWSDVGLDDRATKACRIGIERNHRLVRQRGERGDTAPVTPRSCQLRAALQTVADTEETPPSSAKICAAHGATPVDEPRRIHTEEDHAPNHELGRRRWVGRTAYQEGDDAGEGDDGQEGYQDERTAEDRPGIVAARTVPHPGEPSRPTRPAQPRSRPRG